MKIKHQLSVATLVMAGVFATGCSQQSVMGEGASQVKTGREEEGTQGTWGARRKGSAGKKKKKREKGGEE